MSRLSEEKASVLSQIDAILTIIETSPNFTDMFDSFNIRTNINPFGFLLDILKKITTEEEIMNFLTKMIVFTLPTIELGVKGVILSNLKATIDCNNDPRIPWQLRKPMKGVTDRNSIIVNNELFGMYFPVRAIDYNNIFKYSPLQTGAERFYFGTSGYYEIKHDNYKGKKFYSRKEALKIANKYNINQSLIYPKKEITNVYQLARARDFNAFMWFVMNKACFITSTKIDCKLSDTPYNIYQSSNEPVLNNLGCFSGSTDTTVNNSNTFIGGNTIIQEIKGRKSTVISLCTKNISRETYTCPLTNVESMLPESKIGLKSTLISNYSGTKNIFEFVPVSNDYKSANWYVNRKTFFNFLKPRDKRKERNYSEEFALCNLSYSDLIKNDYNDNDWVKESFLFTIMPKPYTLVTKQGLFRLLFNAKGERDKKGKYSVSVSNVNKVEVEENGKKKVLYYELDVFDGSGKIVDKAVIINPNTNNYFINRDGEDVEITASSILFECYPGLTIYEFNYDFVMGMQLFDPVTLTSQLLGVLTNSTASLSGNGVVGLSFGISKSETFYQMRISEIVKKVIEQNAYEVSDCFYTFPNEKYESMLHEAELKRSKLHKFENTVHGIGNTTEEEIRNILNDFDVDGDLHENEEIVKRAITKATAKIQEEILPEDKYETLGIDLISDAIRLLASVIVETILSPKMVILLELNRRLYQSEGKSLNIEAFIESIMGLLIAIISEIRDLLLRELLNFVLSKLRELIEKLGARLIAEKAEYYARLMKLLLRACAFKASHRKPLESKLDEVDYADIDEIEQPKTDNC